jgi:thiol-disulfide isomerase/thioredoxin
MGINHKPAPELRVPHWIDPNGNERVPLKLAELGYGYKLIYCFQAWCPSCHSRGFPTLKKLVDELSGKGFGFAAVQTVFEGEAQNTPDKLKEMQDQYGVRIPFGHDRIEDHYPTVMEDYRTAGTPWFILINPDDEVIFNDFGLDATRFQQAFGHEDVEYT